jgi:hypothetical protein
MKMKFVNVQSMRDLKPAALSQCEKHGGGANGSTRERANWVRHFLAGEPVAGLELMAKRPEPRRV